VNWHEISWPAAEVPYERDVTILKHEHEFKDEDSWEIECGVECHICPKCFDERLIPWLKSQGANLNDVKP
jgi:hypothetical protein